MKRGKRARLGMILGGAAVLWLALLGRGAYLCLFRHAAILAVAREQQTQVSDLPAERGAILDRTGLTLSCTMKNPSVAVHPAADCDREALAHALRGAGVCSAEQAADVAACAPGRYLWVERGWLSPRVVDRLRDAAHPAIRVTEEMKRFYPQGPVAPEIVGLVGVDGHGLSGLEWRFDELLSGRPGRVLEFVTGGGRVHNAPPPQVLERARRGGALSLTLDARMQKIARHRLRRGMARVGASAGFVLLLDPRTGEILAICEEPSFDPLDPSDVPPERLRASCITDQYEPGSTFKVVPYAAGLEAGLISPSDSLDCGEGERRLESGERIRDHRAFGTVTIADAFSHSSNIGAGKVAEAIGWEGVFRMAQAMGFGLATGVELGGEVDGTLPHPLGCGWSERSLVTAAYGQEVACTGLQMALAYAAVANGGYLMKPRLIQAELDGAGRPIRGAAAQVVRRVMSPETAQTLREMMRTVVASGTGTEAEVTWFPPAGKTGTAQVFDPESGRYSEDEHILSFVGFAPYDEPRILCEVVMQCTGDLHASDAAAPVFGHIISDLVWRLEQEEWDVTPAAGGGVARVTVPDVRGLDAQAARRAIRRVGLIPVLEGMGQSVVALRPPPYRALEAHSVVHLSLGGVAERATVQVPDVGGLSLRRAVAVLTEAGFSVGVDGCGWVVRQYPTAGTDVAPPATCRLSASPNASRARRNEIGGPTESVAWAHTR